MTKLVIFDLDGTLLDTLEDLAISTNHALAQNGFPQHDTEAYRFSSATALPNSWNGRYPRTSAMKRQSSGYDRISSTIIPYTIWTIPNLIRAFPS